ncbi:MAG: DUF2628 domain-containing protein [Bacteroidota bacterium]
MSEILINNICSFCENEISIDSENIEGLSLCKNCSSNKKFVDNRIKEISNKLSNYYVLELLKIGYSAKEYGGQWNWSAFFGGAVWALFKRLWKSTIFFTVIFILLLSTFYFLAIVFQVMYHFYLGHNGNRMIYDLVINKKHTIY